MPASQPAPPLLSSAQLGVIFGLIAAFLFSSKAILIKQAYAVSPTVDANILMFLRMSSALPFFLCIAWFNRQHSRQIAKMDWFLLLIAGLVGYYIASYLDFIGLMYISASLERIILFLYPTLTVIAISLFYRQPLRPIMILALLLSYGGTVIVLQQEQQLLKQNNFWLGASLVFASAVMFACYLLLTPRLIQRFGSWNFTGLALSIACLGTMLHFWLATPQPLQHLQSLPAEIWCYGLLLGFFVTVLPTLLLAQSIKRLGASHSAIIASLGPVLTIILAVLLLGEQMNSIQYLGCLLNIIGVMLITLSKNRLAH
ncbi:DMT family transporter [Acinetobacter larvae]|uniref:EamA family transporter n=1 Tax=Acinetobacter larvae TaxID=1789224 RepID=A0A1B2M1Z3_9GAMM|nr:DMT family transporter [Acinetobacter larvae]AOA59189.1 EamA family transporter [Acinetobacter larvae]